MAMKFPQYVSTSERTVSVVGMLDKKVNLDNDSDEVHDIEYLDGKGYIDEDEYIWIFSAAGKPKNKNAYPYFWLNEDGEKEFSDPPELIKKAYSINNMADLSLVSIVDNTKPGEQLFNEEEINDINAAAAFFVPTIKEDDDFLKRLVKTIIIEKGVDINRLKNKTNEKYQLSNMRAALQGSTKMSVIYFNWWMNLLGCHFDIIISDNGEDVTDKLKNPLVYQSYRDGISKEVNGELLDVNTEKYVAREDENEE